MPEKALLPLISVEGKSLTPTGMWLRDLLHIRFRRRLSGVTIGWSIVSGAKARLVAAVLATPKDDRRPWHPFSLERWQISLFVFGRLIAWRERPARKVMAKRPDPHKLVQPIRFCQSEMTATRDANGFLVWSVRTEPCSPDCRCGLVEEVMRVGNRRARQAARLVTDLERAA